MASSKLSVCPPIVAYSKEFQSKAADEFDALPPGSALAEMIRDYAVERAMLRACQ